MHNKHVIDHVNKDINTIYPTKESYLKLTDGFVSKFPDQIVTYHDNVAVVRDDIGITGGTKSRAAEYLFTQIKEDVVVYVAPRFGLAPTAIKDLCDMYGKEVVFFMPSSKEISDHQAAVIKREPKDVIFKRIAAMPNLNRIAKRYAEDRGYKFLKFGLDHPFVVAGLVRLADNIQKKIGIPKEVWSAVSTGVLTRGLQIGFNKSQIKGVAVARNMKSGELGRTNVISEPLAFQSKEKLENLPPFDSVLNYDAKVWKYVPKEKGVLFWNVSKELPIDNKFDKKKINSFRDWDKNIK